MQVAAQDSAMHRSEPHKAYMRTFPVRCRDVCPNIGLVLTFWRALDLELRHRESKPFLASR